MQPALALLEFSSIAAGIEAGDAMVKRAPLEATYAGTVPPVRCAPCRGPHWRPVSYGGAMHRLLVVPVALAVWLAACGDDTSSDAVTSTAPASPSTDDH